MNLTGNMIGWMGRRCGITLLVLAALGLNGWAEGPSIIPAPLSAIETAATLQIRDGAVIAYPEGDARARFAAQYLKDLVQRTRGLNLVARAEGLKSSERAKIVLLRHPTKVATKNREAYDLDISSQRVTITAPGDAGLFYGVVTLWQMLTATDVWSGTAQLKGVRIHDEPQMQWRGIMLDSARHMQTVAFIRKLIDQMALEKLNVLHWHLTDDQGWRLEIKRYPKLTSIGAWRVLPSQIGKIDPATGRPYRYGGYYTQVEVRSLVAYAAERNVMIVPEIEMPGHASAALAAYSEFGSTDAHLTAPVNEDGIFPYLYNVNDATFAFLENILTEVMALFPSPYIHIGGDEAIKDQWKASPTIQAQMKRLGIQNEDELQSYFTKRIGAFLAAHHRRMVGWDEILKGGLAPGAVVMSWHGVRGGVSAAEQGHDAVLTPTRPLYFNYRQSDASDEAPGRAALNTLEDVYRFNPTPTELTPAERQHILGVQACLWTNYSLTADRDEWMLFPRAAALAEVGWTPQPKRDWNDFLNRMVTEMRRYHVMGVRFAPSAFRVRSAKTLEHGPNRVAVKLYNQTNFGTIRYTTDGSDVTVNSATYKEPLDLPLPLHLRAASFSKGDRIQDSELDRRLNTTTVSRRYSQNLKLCINKSAIQMEPDPPVVGGPVILVNYRYPCWIYQNADLTNVEGISAGVASLPYAFRSKNNKTQSLVGNARTPNGELEVHLDTCTGKTLATLPLQPAIGHGGVTALHASCPELKGVHDLCLKIVRPKVDPLWAVDWVQLDTAGEKR